MVFLKKNVILSQLQIIFHQVLIFFKWLETGCLFHKKARREQKEKRKAKAKMGGSLSVAGEFEIV